MSKDLKQVRKSTEWLSEGKAFQAGGTTRAKARCREGSWSGGISMVGGRVRGGGDRRGGSSENCTGLCVFPLFPLPLSHLLTLPQLLKPFYDPPLELMIHYHNTLYQLRL